MRTPRLSPTRAAVPARSVLGTLCVFFLLVAGFCCSARVQGQQAGSQPAPAASPGPAAQSPPADAGGTAADDAADSDTLDTTPASDETEDGSDPNQPHIVTVPALKPSPGEASQADAPAPIVKPVPASAGGDAQRQQINDECANLLYLARKLNAEVAKTNMDQLSVPVVLGADQIQQLARKMRDQMRPVLSSRK